MLDLNTTFFTQNRHKYSVACTGMKFKEKLFGTRQMANEYLYEQCSKKGLRIEEVWKDHHDVTFICNNNVRFYVQRV